MVEIGLALPHDADQTFGRHRGHLVVILPLMEDLGVGDYHRPIEEVSPAVGHMLRRGFDRKGRAPDVEAVHAAHGCCRQIELTSPGPQEGGGYVAEEILA